MIAVKGQEPQDQAVHSDALREVDCIPTRREEYRVFTPDDLDACAHLYVDVFNAPPWRNGWTMRTATVHLLDLFDTPGFFGVVATQTKAGLPIAFLAGHREQWPDRTTFHLKEVCVRADLQGQGIGTRLLKYLESELATRMGVATLYLATMRDSPAESFYRKNGYRIQERIVLMSRRIGSPTE